MRPISFPEVNKELTKPSDMTDEQCKNLPVYNNGTQSISLWKMSFGERVAAFFRGKIWLSVRGGVTQPPVFLSVEKSVFEKETP